MNQKTIQALGPPLLTLAIVIAVTYGIKQTATDVEIIAGESIVLTGLGVLAYWLILL